MKYLTNNAPLEHLRELCEKYPVLSFDDERKLIAQNLDNRDRLNELLFFHNVYLVFNFVNKYYYITDTRRSMNDLVQDGMLGLSEAVNRFDPTLNIKFVTFAYNWIKKYVLMYSYSRAAKVDRGVIDVDMYVMDKDGSENTTKHDNVIEEKIDPTSYIQMRDTIKEVERGDQISICNTIMAKLKEDTSISAIDYEIFTKIVYEHGLPADLSVQYNVTPSHVSDVRRRCISKLKKVIKKTYGITKFSDISSLV